MARDFSKLRSFELCSVRGLSAGFVSVALALSLSSCGVPSQNNAEPIDAPPVAIAKCPAFGAGGRALQTSKDQIGRIVATTILDELPPC